MTRSAAIYIRIPPHEIGMFRFLLEAYENLALATTIDRHMAILKVRFARESRTRLDRAILDIGRTIPIEIVPVTFDSEKGEIQCRP